MRRCFEQRLINGKDMEYLIESMGRLGKTTQLRTEVGSKQYQTSETVQHENSLGKEATDSNATFAEFLPLTP